jgi:uncharacterized protein YggE
MIRIAAILVAALAIGAAPVATAQIQQETTLVLRGEGKVEMKPDFAQVFVGVNAEAPQAIDAMNQQNAQMTAVVAALKKAGIAERDIRTSNLSLNQTFQPYQAGVAPRPRGYTASNRVTVKVRNVDKLGATIDAIVSAGSNSISGVSFGVENNEQPRKQARANAVKDAMAKAEDYAAALGLRIRRIVNVAEPNVSGPRAPVSAMQEVVVVTSSYIAAPTPVEAGEVAIIQVVDVTFELAK